MVNDQVRQLFIKFRKHQMDVWANGGGMLCTFPSGRTELTFASAPFGEHAKSAFTSAKRHAAFINSRCK